MRKILVVCVITFTISLIPEYGICGSIAITIEESSNIISKVPVEKKSLKIKKRQQRRSKLQNKNNRRLKHSNYRAPFKKGLIYSTLAVIFITLAIGLTILLFYFLNSLNGYAAAFLAILFIFILLSLTIFHIIFSINALIQFRKSVTKNTLNTDKNINNNDKIKKRRFNRNTLRNSLD
ncbi:hypothetical protein OAK19_02750 [Aureispira]|nr:hypothetical protein [Aureispira sp.]